jgi:hypothetical protein
MVLLTILASMMVITGAWTSGMCLGYLFSPGIVAQIFPRHSKSGGLSILEAIFLLITGSIVLFNALFSSLLLTVLSLIFSGMWYGVKRRSRKESKNLPLDILKPISSEVVAQLISIEPKAVFSEVENFDKVFIDVICPK